MRSMTSGIGLLLGLLITGCAAPNSEVADSSRDQGADPATGPSITKGDPPPGNALNLSVFQARTLLKDAIKKRYVGKFESCQSVLFVTGCYTAQLSEAKDISIRAMGFDFTAPYAAKITAGDWSRDAGKVVVKFKKDQEYILAYPLRSSDPKIAFNPGGLYDVGYLPNPAGKPLHHPILQWSDKAAADDFAVAFNRLLYAAIRDEEFAAFRAAARTWRESGAKPGLGPEAERHRILAENAIKEKNLSSTIDHYESALEVQPMWPAGWFNLALIYAEEKDYADASNCMRRYLELAPDASDANDARVQMIIWNDKAGQ